MLTSANKLSKVSSKNCLQINQLLTIKNEPTLPKNTRMRQNVTNSIIISSYKAPAPPSDQPPFIWRCQFREDISTKPFQFLLVE